MDILEKLPEEDPQKRVFIAKCIRWTESCGVSATGSPQLHHLLGIMFWKGICLFSNTFIIKQYEYIEGKYLDAERRFLLGTRADSPISWARMLFSIYIQDKFYTEKEEDKREETKSRKQRLFPSAVPVGRYIARAVLHYLARGDHRAAHLAFKSFSTLVIAYDSTCVTDTPANIQRDPEQPEDIAQVPVFHDKWMNLCQLLLEVTRRDARDVFVLVKDAYRIDLGQDQEAAKMIEGIGELYFGIQPPRNTPGAPFQQLMASLFSGV